MARKENQATIFAGDVTVNGKLTASQAAQQFVVDAIETGADSDLSFKTGATTTTQAKVKHVASAVNTVGLKGAATTNPVEVIAEGTDSNVDVKVTPKGTGQVVAAAPVVVPTYTVATAPDATLNAGALAYFSDGNAGSACLACSNGTNWLIVALGAAVHNP